MIKKNFLPLTASVVMVLSVFLILFLNPPKTTKIQPEQKLTPTATPTPDDLAWQKYENGDYGFYYPQGLEMNDNYLILSQNNKINFSKIADSSKTITEYLSKQDKISSTAWEGQPSIQIKTSKKTMINGLNCIQRQEYLLAADIDNISTYFKNGNYIYKVEFQPTPGNSQESDISIYNQILSTFKFIPEMSTWKTYKNTEYGFEFKYPSQYKVSNYEEDIGDNKKRWNLLVTDPTTKVNCGVVTDKECNKEMFRIGLIKDHYFLPDANSPKIDEVFGKNKFKTYHAEKYEMFDIFYFEINDLLIHSFPENPLLSNKYFDQILSTFKFTK